MNNKDKIRSFITAERIVLIISMLIIFVIGINIVGDYGVSVDEPVERVSSLMLYQTIFPNAEITAPEYENSTGSYWNRYYMAIQLPAAVIEGLQNFELTIQQVYLFRHLYTFLLFFAGLTVFYMLIKKITGKRWLGIIGLWMLVLSPRIFGEAFYNIKDIPALVTCIFSLYFGMRFLEKSSVVNMLLFAAFGALFTNTRIVGAILIISCLLVFFIISVRQRKWGRGFIYSFFCGLISLFIYILLSPNMWDDIIGSLVRTVSMFSSYDHDPLVYYMGQNLTAKNLPWHYLFVWIFITTPLIYTLFSLSGIIIQIKGWLWAWKNKDVIESKTVFMLFPFLTLLIPILYFVFMRPVIYNGWRHFYFLYPIIILYAVIGFKSITEIFRRKNMLKYVPSVLLGLSMLFSGIWMVRSHPYEFLYFNPAVRNWGYSDFEKDYWSVTERDLLQWICDNDKRDQVIKVGNSCMSAAGEMLLYEGNRNRLALHTEYLDADYVYHIFSNGYEEELFPDQCMYDEVYKLDVDGHQVGSIMQRKYSLYAQSEVHVMPAKSQVYYNLNGAQWNYQNASGRHILYGSFEETIRADMISLYTENGALLKNVIVEVSSDGIAWDCLNPKDGFNVMKTQAFVRDSEDVKYIKISFDENTAGDLSFKFNLYKDLDETAGGVYSGKIDGIDASINTDLTGLAMDFLDETAWTTGILQQEGMEVDIKFHEDVSVEYIVLTQGGWGGDYPRNLSIYMFNGSDMEQIPYDTDDKIVFHLAQGRGKVLKLVLGAPDETQNANWAVYEAKIFTAIPMN